jgi:hypothetical protein
MKISFALCAVILAVLPIAGQNSKPAIVSIKTLPSIAVPNGPWACTAGSAGYLEVNGRTKLTDSEIGKIVSQSLRDGYTLTLYPQTKLGIFVDAECNAAAPSTSPR